MKTVKRIKKLLIVVKNIHLEITFTYPFEVTTKGSFFFDMEYR